MFSEKISILIESVIKNNEFEKAAILAGKMIACGDDIPENIEGIIIEFISDSCQDSFTLLAREVLFNRFMKDIRKDIRLISFLGNNKWISLKDTAGLLTNIRHAERKYLSENICKIIQAADLVFEDSQEGFAQIEDDDFFKSALRKLDQEVRLSTSNMSIIL